MLEKWLIGRSFYTGPIILTSEYEKQKEQIQERMIHAAENGDKKQALETLADISKLYEIYREA